MVVALTEIEKSGGKFDRGSGRGFCFKHIKLGTKKMDIQVKLSTQLWEMQMGRLGEWPWQQERFEWGGSSFKMVMEAFGVIAVISGKRTVGEKRPRQGAVIGWLLWETDSETEICVQVYGLLEQHL